MFNVLILSSEDNSVKSTTYNNVSEHFEDVLFDYLCEVYCISELEGDLDEDGNDINKESWVEYHQMMGCISELISVSEVVNDKIVIKEESGFIILEKSTS